MKRLKPLRGWVAVISAFAFLAAANYCTLEALAAHPAADETSHHSDSHDAGVPARGDDGELCCMALQAILQPKTDFGLARSDALVFQLPALQARQPELPAHLFRVTSGLSPPIRDPAPRTPFYRTTFASHAPPAFLA
jgi:hypothetical protein